EGLPAAMAQGERAQSMTLVHLEDDRLEQRVVRAAGEPEALVGEHMAVELDVLADLAEAGALQPGFQQFERGVEIELLRRRGVFMRERQVDRLVDESARHAHTPRGPQLEARPLG